MEKKKGHGCLITIAIIVIVIVLLGGIMATFGNDNNNGKKQVSKNESSQTLKKDKKNDEKQTAKQEEKKKDETVPFKKNGEIDDGLVLKINKIASANEISAGDGYLVYTPDSGKYAIVNVTIKNNSKESKQLLLNYFTLLGPDEAQYTSSMLSGADDKFITVDTINPNLDITGNLAFEIPKDLEVKDCVLIYSDYDLFSDAKHFKLK